MKKICLPLLLVAAFAATSSLSAQTDMVWDTHGVGFTVPDDFEIQTNNADEFTATNGNLLLSIVPIQDETITEDNLADAVLEMARTMEYDVVDEADAIEIDDFVGYYVKGTLDGVNAVVMALLDTESSTNLLVVIAYNAGYEEGALRIAGSFYAYD